MAYTYSWNMYLLILDEVYISSAWLALLLFLYKVYIGMNNTYISYTLNFMKPKFCQCFT